MTYGEKIRQSRERKGMTQEELAEKLGISRQAVSKWEGDLSRPTAVKLAALTALLDLPPETWSELDKEAEKQVEALAYSEYKAIMLHNLKRWKTVSAVLAIALCVSLLVNAGSIVRRYKQAGSAGASEKMDEADISEVFPKTLQMDSVVRDYEFKEISEREPEYDLDLTTHLAEIEAYDSPERVLWRGSFEGETGPPEAHLKAVRATSYSDQYGRDFWNVYVLYALPDEAGELNWQVLTMLADDNIYINNDEALNVEAFTNVLEHDGFKISLPVGASGYTNLYVTRRNDGVPCVMAELGGTGTGAMEYDVDEDGSKELIEPGGLPEYWTIYDMDSAAVWTDVYRFDVENCGVPNLTFDAARGGFVVKDSQENVLVRYTLREGEMLRQSATAVTAADYPDAAGTKLIFDTEHSEHSEKYECDDPDTVITGKSVRITPRQQAYLALQQLYSLTGQRFDQLYCSVDSGTAYFSLLENGLDHRCFYSADVGAQYGGSNTPSVHFSWKELGNDWSPLRFQGVTERADWPGNRKESLRWYYDRLYLMQAGETAHENEEGLWLTNGGLYEGVLTETEWGLALEQLTGPYPAEEGTH